MTTATSYVYNLDRQIMSRLTPDGINVSVEYDTVGCGGCGPTARPKRITFSAEGGSASGGDRGQLGFFYHPATGLLSALTAPGGNTLSYTYDGSLPTSVQWSGEVNGSVGVTYDSNFRVTQQRVNGGNAISYSYDQDRLLTSAGEMSIMRDLANGRITGTQLGNVTTSQSYSEKGELATYEAKFGATSLFSTTYSRGSLRRITELRETVEGKSRKMNYAYDVAGRLEKVWRNDTLISAYTYDSNGNRLSHTPLTGTVTGTYDAQDRLLMYGSTSYGYTRNGELAYKVEGIDTTKYTYDAFGNLVQVQMPNGDLIEYIIDGQNRRVGKKVNGQIVSRWLYSAQLALVAELDSLSNVVSRFAGGYMTKGGATYQLVTDHLGSVSLVVNTSTGAVVQRIDYDEFGNVIGDSNPGFQPFGFAAGLFDASTKLTRFGFRDYDAGTGRWNVKDPIGFYGRSSNVCIRPRGSN